MLRAVAVVVSFSALAACSHAKDATGGAPSASGAATSSSSCALGAPCSAESSLCTPEPLGTGWSHGMMCSGGKWTELEIAPLPARSSAP